MTTIAWDGVTLAADRRMTSGNGIYLTSKIRVIRGHLVGVTGSFPVCLEMMEWFERGAIPAELPPIQRDVDKSCGMFVVAPDGTLSKYENGPFRMPVHDRQFAMGSGGDFARAAMHLGRTAAESVEVAALFDPGTGNGVDELRLPP